MKPVDGSNSMATDTPQFSPDTNLSTLITASIDHDGPLRIVDEANNTIGTIEKADLLKTVIEGTEKS